MFRFDPGLKAYLHHEAVDGRKNINGLALLVEQGLGLDPFAPALSSSATGGATGSASCTGIEMNSG